MFDIMIPPSSRQLSAQFKHNQGQGRLRPGRLEQGQAESGLTKQKHLHWLLDVGAGDPHILETKKWVKIMDGWESCPVFHWCRIVAVPQSWVMFYGSEHIFRWVKIFWNCSTTFRYTFIPSPLTSLFFVSLISCKMLSQLSLLCTIYSF